jgi:photosystem II stability/assembly factor-like uncharacterized protein
LSASVAWALSGNSTVIRTTDGGRSWQPMVRVHADEPLGKKGSDLSLAAGGADSATVAYDVTHGHGAGTRTNIVVVRIDDGHVRQSVVMLPRG